MSTDTLIAVIETVAMFVILGVLSYWLNKKFPGKITYKPPRRYNELDITTPEGSYRSAHPSPYSTHYHQD